MLTVHSCHQAQTASAIGALQDAVRLLLPLNSFSDHSTYSNTVDNHSAVISSDDSVNTYNQSLYCDGSGYISVSDSVSYHLAPNENDFTIEFWAKLDSTQPSARPTLFARGIPEGSGWGLYIYYDQLTFGATSEDIHTYVAPTYDEWAHYAVSRSGSNLYIFLNGEIILSKTSFSSILHTTYPLAIGCSSEGLSSDFIVGYFQDVRVTIGYARYTDTFTPPLQLTSIEVSADACTHNQLASAITVAATLVVSGGEHAQQPDTVLLNITTDLSVVDSDHAHSASFVNLLPILIVASSTQEQTTDALTLTQASVVTPTSSLHEALSEHLNLSQASFITLADSDHTQSTDVIALTQANRVTVADSFHAASSNATDVIQAFVLVAHQTNQVQISDAASPVQSHIIDCFETDQPHATQTLNLIQRQVLSTEDSAQTQAIEGDLYLNQANSLDTHADYTGQWVDVVDLTQANRLVLQFSNQSHFIENVSILAGGHIYVAQSRHSHTLDSVDLKQSHLLNLPTRHDQLQTVSSAFELIQRNTITLSEPFHSQDVDRILGVLPNYWVWSRDSLHDHQSDTALLDVHYSLSISDAIHAHLLDNAVVGFSIADAIHAHVAGDISLILPTISCRRVFVASENRQIKIGGEQRIAIIAPDDRRISVCAETRTVKQATSCG